MHGTDNEQDRPEQAACPNQQTSDVYLNWPGRFPRIALGVPLACLGGICASLPFGLTVYTAFNLEREYLHPYEGRFAIALILLSAIHSIVRFRTAEKAAHDAYRAGLFFVLANFVLGAILIASGGDGSNLAGQAAMQFITILYTGVSFAVYRSFARLRTSGSEVEGGPEFRWFKDLLRITAELLVLTILVSPGAYARYRETRAKVRFGEQGPADEYPVQIRGALMSAASSRGSRRTEGPPTMELLGLPYTWNWQSTSYEFNVESGVMIGDAHASSTFLEGIAGPYPPQMFIWDVKFAVPPQGKFVVGIGAMSSLGGRLEEMEYHVMGNSGPQFDVQDWYNPSSYHEMPSPRSFYAPYLSSVWLRLLDDGTYLSWYYSTDGGNWYLQWKEPRASSFLASTGFNYLAVSFSPYSSSMQTVIQASRLIVPGRQAAAPTFNPAPPATGGKTEVAIRDATLGATITYCSDATNTCIPSRTYIHPLTARSTGFIRAQATADGYTASAISSWQGRLRPQLSARPRSTPGLHGADQDGGVSRAY